MLLFQTLESTKKYVLSLPFKNIYIYIYVPNNIDKMI